MPVVDENGEAEETGDESAQAKGGALQAQRPGKGVRKGKGDKEGESEIMKKDGLKLRIELDLDIELELKAKISGSITLALL